MLRTSFLTLLVLLFTSLAEAATYYVATTGSGTTCSLASPCADIQTAYNKTVAGDTVSIADGTYSVSSSGTSPALSFNKTGSSGARITVQAQNRLGATINAGGAAFRVIEMSGSYNTLSGLKITGSTCDGLFMTGTFNQVIHNEIYGNATTVDTCNGVWATGGSDDEYYWNNIHNNGHATNLDHGMYIANTRETIANNLIHHNFASGIQLAGYSALAGMKVYNNVVAYNGSPGMFVWQNFTSLEIKNNIFYANTSCSINFYNATISSGIVQNNDSFGNNSGNDSFCFTGTDPATVTQNNNYTSDPQMTNPSGNDYTLASVNSFAVDKGLSLGAPYNVDIAGIQRPQGAGWDIGAYEYVTPGVLVAHYTFNETSGQPQDSSGNANHVTNTSASVIHQTSGCVYGNCISLSGTGPATSPYGGMLVASSSSLALSAWTFEAWVKSTNLSPSLFGAVLSHDNGYYYLMGTSEAYLCGNNAAAGGFGSGDAKACDSLALPYNTWVHIAASYDGQVITFYRGGDPVGTSTPASAQSNLAGALYLGTSQYGENFQGWLDDLYVYNGPRTRAQIKADMGPGIPQGTTWYVRATAVGDSGSCANARTNNDANAKKTIAGGIACAQAAGGAGNTVQVAVGTYTDHITSVPNGSGLGSEFTLKCETDYQCIMNPGTTNLAIDINGNQWVIIRGFKVTTGRGMATCSSSSVQANGYRVCHDLVWQNIEVDGTQGDTCMMGMQGTGADNVRLTGWKIYNIKSTSFPGGCHGFYASDWNRNWEIDHNDIHDNQAYGIQIHWECNNFTTPCIDGFKIHDNILYRNGTLGVNGAGLELEGTNFQIYNNISYSNVYGGILFRSNSAGVVYGNTVWNNSEGGIYSDYNDPRPFTCRNNLAVENGSGNVRNCATLSDHNIISGVGSTYFVSANPSSPDFHLKAPPNTAIDAGVDLGAPYNVDRAGIQRPQGAGWDIGAYEYVTPGGVVTVTITSPTSNPTYSTSSSSLTLGGSSTQIGGNVAWTSDNCGSGATTGTVGNWTTTTITLKAGTCTITVTGTDGSGVKGSDQIVVTYAPLPAGNLVLALGFDEATGLPQDSSTNNNHVISLGTGVTHQTFGCKYGNCLAFNGSGPALVADSQSLNTISTAFTIEVWVNAAIAFSNFVDIVAKVADPNPGGFQFMVGTDSYLCADNGPGGSASGAAAQPRVSVCQGSRIIPNQWKHYTWTYDTTLPNNNMNLYVDGVLAGAANGTTLMISTAPAQLYIGSSLYNEHFSGLLDDLRIYSRALTPTEILADMNTPITPAKPPVTMKSNPATGVKVGSSSSVRVGVP